MRLDIVHDLVKQLTGQRTASNKSRHLDDLTREPAYMVMGYWSMAVLF